MVAAQNMYLLFIVLHIKLKLKVSVCVFLYVCSLIAREWMSRFAPNLAFLFLESTKRTKEGQNSEQVS